MKKILIVEDEEVLREMYREKLSKVGFRVFCAQNSEQGLKLVKEHQPDLVLLDILLPKESGIVFLEKLNRSNLSKKPKILVFSNYDDPTTKRKVKKLGVKGYLIKSNWTPKELVEKIKKFIFEDEN